MAEQTFAAIEPLLHQRSAFRFWAQDILRFSDTDMIGHINNTAYAAYCESGRVAFNRAVLGTHIDGGAGGGGLVIARITINFRAESHFPGVVDIGTAVVAVGRSSFTLGQGLFIGPALVATAEAVLVLIDTHSRKPRDLPQAVRQALAGWALLRH